MDNLVPSFPFIGELLISTVNDNIGGSIGMDLISSCLPSVFNVQLTLELANPAIYTISPATAFSNSIIFYPYFFKIFITFAFSTKFPF